MIESWVADCTPVRVRCVRVCRVESFTALRVIACSKVCRLFSDFCTEVILLSAKYEPIHPYIQHTVRYRAIDLTIGRMARSSFRFR
jgi:hypothetical protein